VINKRAESDNWDKHTDSGQQAQTSLNSIQVRRSHRLRKQQVSPKKPSPTHRATYG